MAVSVPIVRTPWGQTRSTVMGLVVEGESAISLITTPPAVSGAAGAWTVSETDRPGRRTITAASAPGLRSVRFEHRVASPNPNVSVEALLVPLRAAAEKGKRVKFVNAGMWAEGRWWLVRALEAAEELKAADSNEGSRVSLSWECIEASPVSRVVLTKGALKAKPAPPVNPTTPAGNTTDPTKPHMPRRES